MKILSLLIFLLTVYPLTSAVAEKRHKSWKPEAVEKSRHHGDLSSKKHHRSSKHRSHFRGKKHFFLYVDGYRLSPYIRYKQHRQKHVVIERDIKPTVVKKRTIVKTRYIPVEKQPTPHYCGGETVYLRNRTTGELTIRYISPAKKC